MFNIIKIFCFLSIILNISFADYIELRETEEDRIYMEGYRDAKRDVEKNKPSDIEEYLYFDAMNGYNTSEEQYFVYKSLRDGRKNLSVMKIKPIID